MDIVSRAKGMVLTPAQEWQAVAAESTDTADIFRSYVIPMAGIAAIGSALSLLLVGWVMGAIMNAIIAFILACVGVFVIGKIIEFLAPQFGGPADGLAALKLAAFAPTAAWLAQGLSFIPWLGGLIALAGGIYSLYVYYLGGPIVARVAPDKALVFTISIIVAAVVVYIVMGLIASALLVAFIR